MSWYNADGLWVEFGTARANPLQAGELRTLGPQRIVELTIPAMTAVGTNATIQTDTVVIPRLARIERIEIVTDTICTSGGAATLNIGLMRTDRATELDYDGFVAALPLTSIDTPGETTAFTRGSANAGVLLGTTLAFNGILTADWDTAAFTAGAIRIRVFYRH